MLVQLKRIFFYPFPVVDIIFISRFVSLLFLFNRRCERIVVSTYFPSLVEAYIYTCMIGLPLKSPSRNSLISFSWISSLRKFSIVDRASVGTLVKPFPPIFNLLSFLENSCINARVVHSGCRVRSMYKLFILYRSVFELKYPRTSPPFRFLV